MFCKAVGIISTTVLWRRVIKRLLPSQKHTCYSTSGATSNYQATWLARVELLSSTCITHTHSSLHDNTETRHFDNSPTSLILVTRLHRCHLQLKKELVSLVLGTSIWPLQVSAAPSSDPFFGIWDSLVDTWIDCFVLAVISFRLLWLAVYKISGWEVLISFFCLPYGLLVSLESIFCYLSCSFWVKDKIITWMVCRSFCLSYNMNDCCLFMFLTMILAS